VDWGEFRHGVASLHARLSQEHSGAWILLTEDAYSFAVGLFALWHAGCHAILPPNRQPHSLAALQTRAAGVLSDQPNWFASGSPLHPLRDGKAVGPTDLAPLRPDALSVELFTSGTTGDEKPVVKRIAHLEAEVDQLEACWGEQVEGSTFFSTASHQHLYGLLFGVLWPLCTGRPFDAQHLLHAGELVPRMHEAKTSVLASVPTSLKHLARHAGAETLRDQRHAIFSSGGPLPTDTAHAVARVVGHAPIEVLGSTETGGIAWRSQEPETGEALWTPFPCARVTRDAGRGVLRVSSPLVSVEESGEGFATGDRIELLADGRFRLGGRSDQIVKVGEKRLDLTRMASQLRGHEWLEEAALTTIDRESEQRVAAVVVASERGADVLRSEGRRAFTRDLREALAGSWDPVLHPRYWRIVPRLPENTQGKVTREALGQLFQTRGIESGSPDRPEVLEELRGSDFIERACVVPKDLECFAGHFPERVLVPGVLQLDWAMDLLALLQGHAPVVEEIESLKLIAPLDPGMKFRLNVRIVHPADASEATPGATKMEFTLWSKEEKHSIGRVRLAPSIDVIGAGDHS
jgi:acyl-CoA synthetase (AMP-forming)/AMP-acid ligase II